MIIDYQGLDLIRLELESGPAFKFGNKLFGDIAQYVCYILINKLVIKSIRSFTTLPQQVCIEYHASIIKPHNHTNYYTNNYTHNSAHNYAKINHAITHRMNLSLHTF